MDTIEAWINKIEKGTDDTEEGAFCGRYQCSESTTDEFRHIVDIMEANGTKDGYIRLLAQMYENGYGVKCDVAKAVQLYSMAVTNYGDAEACYLLGWIYRRTCDDENYRNVAPDPEKSLYYFRRAYAMNYDCAREVIQMCNELEKYELTFAYIQEEQKRGNMSILEALADMYVNGYGVEKNYDIAIEILEGLLGTSTDMCQRNIRWLEIDLERLQYQIKFIKHVINKEICMDNCDTETLCQKLREFQFPKLSYTDNPSRASYDYITRMSLLSFTQEYLNYEKENELIKYKSLCKTNTKDKHQINVRASLENIKRRKNKELAKYGGDYDKLRESWIEEAKIKRQQKEAMSQLADKLDAIRLRILNFLN